MRNPIQSIIAIAASMATICVSCKKQAGEGAVTAPSENTANPRLVSTNSIGSTFTVNWNNDSTGPYTAAEATADFGNLIGSWDSTRTFISEHYFRVKLLANALSGDGGVINKIDIVDGAEYELDFKVKFHSQFDYSKGGKIGFGFLVGDGNSGGDPGWDGNGGSFRVEWYQKDSNHIYFQPYLYYKDQPGEYGDTFDKAYPQTGVLQRGHWYRIHMYIKSNTGSNTDGRALLSIDDTVVLDTAIRWTTNTGKRLINRICLSTFRGGSQDYWMSATDGYIYFDDLSVHMISQ